MRTIPILYEDNHLLIVEKPVNVPVQEDRSGDPDLLSILKQDLKSRYNKPGNVYLGLVHRLDRPVGGVMVFAKTSKAASRLARTLQDRQFERTYLTVVRGVPKRKKAVLKDFLLKDRRRNLVSAVPAGTKNAKLAILEYEVLNYEDELSLLHVKLYTGRSHQIRVQLATVGHPIYGDQKYGTNINKPGQQIALWAYSVQFPHPVRDEIISIHQPPPNTFPWNSLTASIALPGGFLEPLDKDQSK